MAVEFDTLRRENQELKTLLRELRQEHRIMHQEAGAPHIYCATRQLLSRVDAVIAQHMVELDNQKVQA